jgi:hypothetical protein
MFGFGNWWKSLWTNGCLELYLKDLSIGISWSPFVGFKEFICWAMCYSRNYPKSGHVEDTIQGWSWLSQEWIKLINTQSIQDVPRGIKWSQGMVSIVHYALCSNPWSTCEFYVGLGLFPWVCIKRKISYNTWRMTSSGDRHQDWGVQVQVEHHEEIILEACRPLWCQWTCEDVPKSGSPIVEYGGAIN